MQNQEKYHEAVNELVSRAREKYYSKALAKAKDIREIADYGVIAEISEEEAESVIDDAEKFLVRIKEAINGIQKKA